MLDLTGEKDYVPIGDIEAQITSPVDVSAAGSGMEQQASLATSSSLAIVSSVAERVATSSPPPHVGVERSQR